MVIQAGGHRWKVEVSERSRRHERSERDASFSDFVFRREDVDEERLELGWVPRRERLDEGLARKLFELAGRRRWIDPRDGGRYQAELLTAGSDEEPNGPIHILFRTEGGVAGSTVYPLDRPLGLATVPELQAMMDVALERRHCFALGGTV